MATASLKLTDQLKQRTVALAQKQGVTPHAFMVDAIEHAVTVAEQRLGLLDEAQTARAQVLNSGLARWHT